MALLLTVLLAACIPVMSTKAKPVLKLSKTEDMHILCNMGHFSPRNPPLRVEAMQIHVIGKENGDKKILATLDLSRGPSASSWLVASRRSYQVTGFDERGREREWWLKLLLIDVGPSDFGAYGCTITYLLEKEQADSFVWESDVITFTPYPEKVVPKIGFQVNVERGLDLLCGYDVTTSDAAASVAFRSLSSGNAATELARWLQEKENPEYCDSRALCFVRKLIGQTASLSAHLILNLTCGEMVYECIVGTADSVSFKKDAECFDPDSSTAIHGPGPNDSSGSSDDSGSSTDTTAIVSCVITAVVVVLVLTGVVCCVRRKRFLERRLGCPASGPASELVKKNDSDGVADTPKRVVEGTGRSKETTSKHSASSTTPCAVVLRAHTLYGQDSRTVKKDLNKQDGEDDPLIHEDLRSPPSSRAAFRDHRVEIEMQETEDSVSDTEIAEDLQNALCSISHGEDITTRSPITSDSNALVTIQ